MILGTLDMARPKKIGAPNRIYTFCFGRLTPCVETVQDVPIRTLLAFHVARHMGTHGAGAA